MNIEAVVQYGALGLLAAVLFGAYKLGGAGITAMVAFLTGVREDMRAAMGRLADGIETVGDKLAASETSNERRHGEALLHVAAEEKTTRHDIRDALVTERSVTAKQIASASEQTISRIKGRASGPVSVPVPGQLAQHASIPDEEPA